MSYVISLYVMDIKNINRTIVVNDNLPVQLFVKSLILSMNGNTNNLYLLEGNENIIEFDDTDSVSSLDLKVGDVYQIIYDYDGRPWDLEFVVLEKNEDLNPQKIEIIDGFGYGICLNENVGFVKELMNPQNTKWKERVLSHSKTLSTYFNATFELEENNTLVREYIDLYEDMHQPKSIIMHISLNKFDKAIKRKIIVNNNILIDKFCRAIIASMNGDMEHLYTIKMNKKWYEDIILYEKLNYFDLSVGKKFNVIYDFGDAWQFNIRIAKIIDGYHEKDFEILNGKGYGIVDDCGGVYGLYDVFQGENDYFGPYDINEFNLDDLQKYVEGELKRTNWH